MQCRPKIHDQHQRRSTYPAAEHHRRLAGTKLYYLVTEAHGCEQLAQSRYLRVQWLGVEPVTMTITTKPPPPTTLGMIKKVNICYSAPNRLSHRRGAQVHGAHQAASHIPALNLPSRSRYSFTDHLRTEG